MAIARYNLKIKAGDKVLVALPTTTTTDNHNSWVFPNDLMTSEVSDGDKEEIENFHKLFAQITGIEWDAANIHSVKAIEKKADEDKAYYNLEVELNEPLEVTMSSGTLTRFDKTSMLRIPKYVKFKWVKEDELYYWLTKTYCHMFDIFVSYFIKDNPKLMAEHYGWLKR